MYTQLNDQTVIFLKFSISHLIALNSSVKPIDRTLSDTNTLGHSGLRLMTVKLYSIFPKAPILRKPHYKIFDIQDIR